MSQIGLQLTVAFVDVALAAVIAAIVISTINIDFDLDKLVVGQQTEFTQAVARSTGVAYRHDGWARSDFASVAALVAATGGGLEIRDNRQAVRMESPGFARLASLKRTVTDPVFAGGHRVGSVTVAFPSKQASTEAAALSSARGWTSRIEESAIAVVLAILVALPLSRLIAEPIDRLIGVAHMRTGGDREAHVGRVRGLAKLRELALAFDEMAATRDEQDQLRRNLVADIAHELRNPIAVLQAGHEAMVDGVTKPTPEYLLSLHNEVLRLARMVDDLQRLASAEAAALQLSLVKRDLASIAAVAAASLSDSFAAANVTLTERLEEAEVMTDPLRMHEVVVNLLTNALKFTPSGGEVTLRTERSDGTCCLRVTDTGIGIPEAELPHIAERFFRGQRSAGVAGSGIGLTIVSELVKAHHGSLDFTSKQGQGTQVTVTLPLADSRRSVGAS